LDQSRSEPEKPLLPHLFSGDPTVPGITKLLNLGRASIGIFSDEGGLMIGGYSFAKEQAINTGAAFSRLWDGRPIDRIRGGDDIIKLYDRRVSFHLMIQPKIAGEFLRHEGLSDQGFLTRCLASYPASTVGKRPYQEISLDDPVLLIYQSRLLDILKTPLALREDQRQELDPACVSLDAQAKELWIEFHDYCDSQSSKDGEFDPIKGFANKAPEHALRLATILSGVSDLSNREINLDTIEKAITLTQYYLSEWLRIADEAGIDPDITLAEKLCIWLECRTDDLISAPNIYQSGPYALRNKNDTMRIMRILEGHGYVIKQPVGTKVEGKPRKDVWRVVR